NRKEGLMDRKKLEAALERLEDEKFGRTLNLPGVDPAVIGAWFRWLRDPRIKLENLRSRAYGKQGQPEPVRIADTVPDGGRITPQMRAATSQAANPSPSANNDDALTATGKEVNVTEHEPEK